jgi:hypothetical protein
MLRQI